MLKLIGNNLASKIDTVVVTCHKDYIKDKINSSLYFTPVSKEEVIKVVNNFKSKKSRSNGEVNMAIVKLLIHSIKLPLLHICNLSLAKGVFPDKMKIARVIPIYKSGNANEFNNYRPAHFCLSSQKFWKKFIIIDLFLL